MTRTEALERVIASLRNEIEALKAFDIEALAAATAGKERELGHLAGTRAEEMDEELRALAHEAARLNETARVMVNLMNANVRRQLDRLTGAPVAYGRKGPAQLRVVA